MTKRKRAARAAVSLSHILVAHRRAGAPLRISAGGVTPDDGRARISRDWRNLRPLRRASRLAALKLGVPLIALSMLFFAVVPATPQVADQVVSLPAEPPLYSSMDEERTVDAPGAIPSARGLIGPRQREEARPRRVLSMKDPDRRYGPSPLEGDEVVRLAEDAARFLTSQDGYLQRHATSLTTAAKRLRKEIFVYTVEEGDCVSTIAERFDISSDTVIWANGDLEADPDFIDVGQKLSILPVPGVLHTVKEGDTVESVAKMYKADPEAIIEYEWNRLQVPFNLTVGQKIIVPDGEKPYNPRLVVLPDGRQVMVGAPKGLGRFIWPTQGYITSRFGEGGHRGLDIGAYEGAPIYAADGGAVTYSGPLGNYGLAVIIDHGNGYQSLYGHLSVYYPKAGQAVRRGQAIGKMGSTGKSTGSHLHIEITLWGGLVNPMNYLP